MIKDEKLTSVKITHKEFKKLIHETISIKLKK